MLSAHVCQDLSVHRLNVGPSVLFHLNAHQHWLALTTNVSTRAFRHAVSMQDARCSIILLFVAVSLVKRVIHSEAVNQYQIFHHPKEAKIHV